MLSIGKLTVEQSRYYERQVAQGHDDYYSGRGESPGRWTGSGAETLRLSGRVDDDGFMALMEGRDPGTGERLKRVGGRSKVAAFDLTFSAPKSVSVLFAIGEPVLAGALVEAHEAAANAGARLQLPPTNARGRLPAAWRAAARRMGHGAQLHLRTYAHVIDTLGDTRYPDLDALIAAARADLRLPESCLATDEQG